MTAPELKNLLDAIIRYAPKLREAGIIGTVTIEGLGSFELAREEAAADDEVAPVSRPRNALEDPETFGLGPDDEVPTMSPRGTRKAST